MDRYRIYSIAATILTAIFIVCSAFILTVTNKSIYNKTASEDAIVVSDDISIMPLEAKLNFEQVTEGFVDFFNGEYKMASLELSEANQSRISALKVYYRMAWIIAIITLVGGVYCYICLSKRRMYMPLMYGGALSALLTALFSFMMLLSNRYTAMHIRVMILKDDYASYFDGDDIFALLIPEHFARNLFLLNLLHVFIMILIAALLKWIIGFVGRPHRF